MSEKRLATSQIQWPPFLLLALSVFLVYSDTFHASWHLDDYSNILYDSSIHFEKPDLRSLSGTILGHSRPFARLTFALNWYLGKDSVTGYHIVNIAIHILSSFFLLLTIRKLFETPVLRGKYEGKSDQVAILATFLWAIHPIQIQAVTYIVQRMACMSTMFYLSAIFFYISGRMNSSVRKRFGCFFLVLLGYALGIATKENAVMLPLSLLLVEMAFFKDWLDPKNRTAIFAACGICLAAFLLLVVILFPEGGLFQGYETRTFTPLERVLSQPRALALYLSQICYPLPHRFSIEHDFDFSTSLFSPWETLPCIVLVLTIVIASLLRLGKNPILCFPLLFFFLNHIPESSIIALELVFEHRNYLPSCFLFLPIGIGIVNLIDSFDGGKTRLMAITSVSVLFVAIGMGTYTRNLAWKDEKTLLSDARGKAPKSARILHSLAWAHYEKIGRYDIAMALYGEALNLNFSMKSHKALTYNNMAGIWFQMGNRKKAVEMWAKAVETDPGFAIAKYRIALALAKEKAYGKALEILDSILLETEQIDPVLLKGQILFAQGKIEASMPLFRKCLKKGKTTPISLMYLGMAFTLSEKYAQGVRLLKHGHLSYPKNVQLLLCLVESHIRGRDEKKTLVYIDKLFDIMSINDLRGLLKTPDEDPLFAPVTPKLMWPAVRLEIEKRLTRNDLIYNTTNERNTLYR